jgi:hypothetical protein
VCVELPKGEVACCSKAIGIGGKLGNSDTLLVYGMHTIRHIATMLDRVEDIRLG